MDVSAAGIDLIKRNEGCKLVAYLDTLAKPAVWTIGYGDTLGVYEGMTITQAEADARLLSRLANEFVPGVLRALKGAPVTQNQLDAMASLAWNIGVGRLDNPDTAANEGTGFSGSSVARLHRMGNYAGAADAFRLWNKAGGVVLKGLVRRREEERALYLSAGVPASAPLMSNHYFCAKAMQKALMQAGYYMAKIDGAWGPKSRAAYDAFLRAGG